MCVILSHFLGAFMLHRLVGRIIFFFFYSYNCVDGVVSNAQKEIDRKICGLFLYLNYSVSELFSRQGNLFMISLAPVI